MSSDKKALPSERIKDIADGYVANYPEAIMIFLDEQAELLDTHTVKEEKYCNEENCMAKDDLIPHEHVKEESTTPEKTCPNKGKENCICSQCYMPITPEKKCCKNCGLDYQDPIYCSIFGRSADKHEWI